MDNLAEQIEELNHTLSSQLPEEIFKAFGKSIEELKTEKIEERSLKTGDKMPEFILPNAHGKWVSSREILTKGKMILAFYRGSWCPYCNLELKGLQDHLSEIKNKNAALVAISPQSPDHSLTMIEKNDLEFELLTDTHNTLAEKLGITFQLQEFVLPYYKALGIELEHYNKNKSNTLPVPAVFVIDENGYVIFRFLDVNYMNRINIEELIKLL
ncbi:peroxiredoxin-like family protein [Chryseobacterium indologenes]|uniref:thioredoxin-dependent peroxiredoxin n=1 Tax=Chryseobacterium indologenes TaxID=253 RepID=A0A0N0ZXW4_CHRID|nr:peroxiredoxin-like family protein [Chryseobacterium indologenes]KPE52067.1 alkyl hydroperoxide reductase [Chryseobacterium indologenes]